MSRQIKRYDRCCMPASVNCEESKAPRTQFGSKSDHIILKNVCLEKQTFKNDEERQILTFSHDCGCIFAKRKTKFVKNFLLTSNKNFSFSQFLLASSISLLARFMKFSFFFLFSFAFKTIGIHNQQAKETRFK